jgi:tetratricopeptide (TPR) repeat protein
VFVFFCHNLWQYAGMITRFVCLTLFVFALPLPTVAQVESNTAKAEVEIPAATPVDKAKKQAQEIDRLFGLLHREGIDNQQATIEKIWGLWSRNDSPMAELLLTQSDKALRDGSFDTSEKMLNTLIDSYPDYVEALNVRSMLFYNLKRYDEALADANAVLESEPRHFGALAGRAAIYQALGNAAEAANSLREAIAVNPYMESAKAVLKQLEHDYPNL